MSISGYGEYRPAASNEPLAGSARNRRVDILFVARKDGT
jgi:flagellar motor protein MotB